MRDEKTPPKPAEGEVELLFPSDYLTADDLRGKDVDVRISKVMFEDVWNKRGKERKVVLHFEGKRKKMILRRSNAKQIAKVTGIRQVQQWPGQWITLYGNPENHFNKDMTVLRIRDRQPKGDR